MTDVFLGVDLATASARVLAMSDEGSVVHEAQAALPAPRHPRPGYAEQEPTYLPVVEGLLRHTSRAVAGRDGAVRALCLTGTSGSVVPCDTAGRPIGPALLYNDQRAHAEAAELTSAGHPAPTTSPLARIAWLARNAPAPRYLFVPDVVAAGLLRRVPPTDTSHALKAGVDPVAATWDIASLGVVGLDVDVVPELVHPGEPLGVLAPAAAARTGLSADVALYAGMTDGCTAQIAGGVVSPGDTVGVLGTTLVLKGVAEQPICGFGGVVYSHYAPDGRFWPGGASNVGARVLRSELAGQDLDALEAAAASVPPARALAYPLPGTGERFPFHRPDATSFQVGRAETAAERFRVLMEGVAFTERLGLEALGRLGLEVGDRHRAVGGGSRNHLWNTIRATVLGRPLLRPAQATSAYGAALLACSSYTGAGLAETTERLVRTAEVVEPDAAQTAALEDGYGRWLEALRLRGYLAPSAPTPPPHQQREDM